MHYSCLTIECINKLPTDRSLAVAMGFLVRSKSIARAGFPPVIEFVETLAQVLIILLLRALTPTIISSRRHCLVRPCDKNIQRTIQLTQEMIRLANQGDEDREDTGCGVLYGVLRDSAYKILQMAEKEKGRHRSKGWWQEHVSPGGKEDPCDA